MSLLLAEYVRDYNFMRVGQIVEYGHDLRKAQVNFAFSLPRIMKQANVNPEVSNLPASTRLFLALSAPRRTQANQPVPHLNLSC